MGLDGLCRAACLVSDADELSGLGPVAQAGAAGLGQVGADWVHGGPVRAGAWVVPRMPLTGRRADLITV